MSDTNTTTEASKPEAAPRERKAKTFTATLRKGMNYSARVNGKVYRFKQDVAVRNIPADVVAYLRKTAVDTVTITDGDGTATSEPRQKFEFEEA